MAYPVDILTNVDHESLELAAEEYMSQLPCRNPNTAEYLILPDSKQIKIGLGNVSFVPLYGADTTKKLLALFSSDDFTTVVGLYLLGQWWGVEDVLKTAEPSRTGLTKVSTLGERIVLYVLNRIVLRNEKSSEDVSFLCHCDHESAKILWKDGEAIGFYSYKPKGSLCRNFLTQCYQLPVMDTVFVRKCHRGKGHGIKILEDFVGNFRKEYIGLKFPLSEAMYKVCEKYFSIYPADKEILWEVEKIGSPFQRTLIAKRLQKLKLKAEKDQVVSKLEFEEDDVTAPMEIEITKVQETTEYTVEIAEETITDTTKEVDDIPVIRCGRGSNLKRRGIREDSEERLSTNIIRVEDIEAGVESPIEVATEEHLDETFSVKESETVLRSTTDTVIATVTNISELRSSQKEEEQEIEKDKVTATLEGTPVTLLTTGEIKSQRGSEEECEMVNLEHTVVIQGATIGSIDQSQLQSVVDIEIVKMSTGTEEEQNENLEKNKEVEEDKPVCEAEKQEIKKVLDEPKEEKALRGTVETYNNTEALEEVTDQSGTLANKAEAESEVEEYKEKEELTVETDFTMDAEITQIGETVDVVPEISEIDQEEAPQQSSVESAEVQKLKTAPEEDEEKVENISKMLTLSEAKVVLVDLHKLSHKEASDNNREIDIAEQDEIKHTISSEQQAAEEIMRMEEQDGTLDTIEGYNVATDAKRTPEQSNRYKEQEGEPEPETAEVVILSQVEKPEEKTNTEQAREDVQKKGSIDTPSKSTSLRDQPINPGVTVRCLRSTLKPIKITPVRRSTRSKAVIQQVESIEPQGEAKFRTEENPERDEVIAEDVGPEKSEKANTNVDETVVIESGSSELLKATEIDYKEKIPQITEATEGDIPLVEAESDEDVTEKVKEIKKMENKEANLARQIGTGIEMSSLAQAKSTVEATEKVMPFVEAVSEEDVVEKEAKEINNMENRETNLAVTKDTDEEAPEMGEEANLEQQKNEPLVKNEKETAETEKPMEVDLVVSKEQTYVVEGTTIQIEEVSQVESTETNQSDNAKITRRSSRLSAKSVTSTQNTRKSTRLHIAELEPVKEADMSRNEYKESSATTERTVNVCIPIITVETNLESPHEIPNTNVEKTSAVGPETSVLLMGVETEDKKEAPKVTLEAEPGEEVEKDNGTPIVQVQKPTVVLVDLNKLSQSTEGESDTPEVLVHSKTEEQLELDESKSEYQLRIQTSEHQEQQEELQKEENTGKTPEEEEDKMEEVISVEVQNKLDKQEMTFEGQRLADVLEEQNDVKETEIVEEYKAVIDEDVEEAVTSVEHPDATTMTDKTNIIKEKENDEDIVLKEKQTNSDVEMSSLAQEALEAVQEILEEEVPFSTERILRHRKIKVHSPPRRKSRRVQNQEAEADVDHQERHTVVTKNKPEAVSEETVEEMDQEVNMRNEEASLAELEPVEEDTEKVVPLVEGEPEEDVIEKGFEEINKMESKETSLENDAAPEMGRDEANLEQHEKESLVKNDKETAKSEKHMEIDKVPSVCKEQTYVIEETTIQVEEKVSQMESSENKSERITRRGLRISAQSATSTQKTRKSTRLHTAELEPVKEADMSRNEGTSSTTVETVNVCVPIITAETNMGSPWKDGDSMSRKVETTSYEQERDISTDKGKVDEALPDKATDEQDETKSSTKTTENEIMVEMDKTQKVVEGGVQDDEKAEPPQEDTDQKLEKNIQEKREDEVRTSSVEKDTTQQEEAVSKEENVGETNPTNEFKTTAVEGNVALESSDHETPLITRRSLRYRTVTVQFTPRRKSKRLHRQEVKSEKETKDNICGNEIDSAIQDSADDLNIPIEEENEALNAEKNIIEFEYLKTKEGEGIIQVNIKGKAEETGTKDDTVEVGNETLFEINESNSASPEITEQDKAQVENLEKDVQVPKEQEEEVSSVQEEEKPLQEKENEGAVEGSSFDLEETAVERRTLRKRVTVETAAPRKSKRLRKQEHDEDSEQVKEAVMGQTETVEVTFTDDVELSSEAPAAVFEGSNLGGEIQQNISEGTKSDGDCDIHEDTKTDAGEAQEENKEKRVNKPQTKAVNEEVMEQNSKKVEETGEMEKVIEKHVETEEQKLESGTNKGFTLELEVEETSDQEENKADEESRVAMEAPKDIFTSAEKSDEGEENISEEGEKGLASEKQVLQSSSIISSSRRRSMRLQMHESKKNTTEDESDSEEAEVQQTVKQRHQKKRKAIADLTPARRSKLYVREKIV